MARKEFHWWDDLSEPEGCLLVAVIAAILFIVYIILSILYLWMR